MRVLVDTSVWIGFLNGYPSSQSAALERLIEDEAEIVTCGLIVAEVLQGIRDPKSLQTMERHFREMLWLTPVEPDTFIAAAVLYRKLRARGVTVRSTIDCVIAKLAEAGQVLLLHKDRDLDLILESSFVDVRALPVV